MGYESMLADIKSSLNGKISDVEDKIEKLKKAKKDIDTLQEEAITEIKEIVKPELGKHWTGTKADDFDKGREEAKSEASRIVNDKYNEYMASIQSKIFWLETEKFELNLTKSAANAAGDLLAKGEDFVEEAGRQISKLKWW
ncbi:YwqH-like family protein [Bacillus sp. 0909A]|uniref:YwqH-like family protein n=1 Tax=Bacillus sp. 0909A TaxID=3120561 RepID=UPI002FD90E34